ncbi:hypothetical protein ANN_20009 [Periplaneta americana]|uniref:Uncharacterized protein n=1 Tax=Periplaneta americana TaxID=6978 RepID=A0ABQ8SBF8_PERAM|nr:hypothetical protein ANN_20009 [Periplaneta americana]
MEGLCEGGNEPPGSLKATLIHVIGIHDAPALSDYLISVLDVLQGEHAERRSKVEFDFQFPHLTGMSQASVNLLSV